MLRLAPRDAEAGDLLQWDATIRGPPSGAYEGAFARLEAVGKERQKLTWKPRFDLASVYHQADSLTWQLLSLRRIPPSRRR